MKVFVAGTTGVLGRALVPQLVAHGHEVVGMTRSASKQDLVRSLGARPVVADALDPDAVAQAVASAEPDTRGALRAPLVGILHLERAVTTIEWGEGLVLRYGGFYGPGTAVSLAPGTQVAAPVRKPVPDRRRRRWRLVAARRRSPSPTGCSAA